MNTYKVETIAGVYGKQITFEKANTPYDAAEKALRFLSWRAKEELETQMVLILDGSKKTWTFKGGK